MTTQLPMPMPTPIPTLAPQLLAADRGGLCVEFIWRGDRYQHVIGLRQSDGAIRPLLESIEGGAPIEGTANDDWPPSPPLQSLTIEPLDAGRRAALLVGMAGRSHWSASAEVPPGSGELIFDLACRHGTNPGRLGSSYHWLIPADKRPSIAITANPGRLIESNDQLTIEPVTGSRAAATARWRWIVRLVA